MCYLMESSYQLHESETTGRCTWQLKKPRLREVTKWLTGQRQKQIQMWELRPAAFSLKAKLQLPSSSCPINRTEKDTTKLSSMDSKDSVAYHPFLTIHLMVSKRKTLVKAYSAVLVHNMNKLRLSSYLLFSNPSVNILYWSIYVSCYQLKPKGSWTIEKYMKYVLGRI